jgi:hypothetical protein
MKKKPSSCAGADDFFFGCENVCSSERRSKLIVYQEKLETQLLEHAGGERSLHENYVSVDDGTDRIEPLFSCCTCLRRITRAYFFHRRRSKKEF